MSKVYCRLTDLWRTACHTPQITAATGHCICKELTKLRHDSFLDDYADVLLWLTMVGGPYTAGIERDYMISLLTKAAHGLFIHDLKSAIAVCKRFIWHYRQDRPAARMWQDAFYHIAFGARSGNTLTSFAPQTTMSACVFCNRRECCSLIRRAETSVFETEVPTEVRGVLWGSSAEELSRMCNGDWWDMDEAELE